MGEDAIAQMRRAGASRGGGDEGICVVEQKRRREGEERTFHHPRAVVAHERGDLSVALHCGKLIKRTG